MSKNKLRQLRIFHEYYSRLKMLALSEFEYEGLPDSCSVRFLEDTLFHHGEAIFVDDEDLGFLTVKVTPSGTLNHYNESISYRAFSMGYDKTFNAHDDKGKFVYIRNNYLAKSTDSSISIFAEKLTLIDLAITVNINAQKTPLLIRTDKQTKISLEALLAQYNDDALAIVASKSLAEKPIDVILTGAPFVADKLREEKRAVWNEALEFLGFNTNPSDKKKERLITNEVDANNEQIDIQGACLLLARQEFVKEINKKFNLNATVRKRTDEERGVENGEIYD